MHKENSLESALKMKNENIIDINVDKLTERRRDLNSGFNYPHTTQNKMNNSNEKENTKDIAGNKPCKHYFLII